MTNELFRMLTANYTKWRFYMLSYIKNIYGKKIGVPDGVDSDEQLDYVGRYVRKNPYLLEKVIDEIVELNQDEPLDDFASFKDVVAGQFYVLKADKNGYAFIKKDTKEVFYLKAYDVLEKSIVANIGLPFLVETTLVPFAGYIFMDIQYDPILYPHQIKNKEELRKILMEAKKKRLFIKNLDSYFL